MHPAQNIPSLVSSPCPSLPMTLALQLQSNSPRDIISHWGVFYNTFPFTVSLPHTLPFPLPDLSRHPFPLPIVGSLPFLGPFLTTLHVLLTLSLVIVIVIAKTALFTAWRSRIRPVLIIIILVHHLIPIQWSNGQEVALLLLPAAQRPNLYPGIIATVPGETLVSAFNLPKLVVFRLELST